MQLWQEECVIGMLGSLWFQRLLLAPLSSQSPSQEEQLVQELAWRVEKLNLGLKMQACRLACMLAYLLNCVQIFQSHVLQPARLFCPWNAPGKNTGVGCLFLFHKMKTSSLKQKKGLLNRVGGERVVMMQ